MSKQETMAEFEKPMEYANSLRRSFLGGISAMALFCGTIGLWAAASPLAGAVVAQGQFVVDSNVKKIQHQTGGIVAVLPVREGDQVKAGDLILRLDETVVKANLQVIVKQLDDLMVRQARLEAERNQLSTMPLPPDLRVRADIPDVAKSIADEERLMQTRRSQRDGQKQQFSKRIEQLREEISGVEAQVVARDQQIKFIEQELIGVRDLFRRNLVPTTRVLPLEREAANIIGQKGQLVAAKAQAEGKIAETQLQLLQLEIDLQNEVGKELRDIQGKTAELSERRIAAEDTLKRVDIRAPIDGFVHQLAVHTIGGVITPAEPAMLIVPFNEELQIEAKVPPNEIDQLFLGQKAVVKVQAGNQRTTPELSGKVSRIAADVTKEPQTGQIYYIVRIAMAQSELAKLDNLKIVSGMQAETYIQTVERTPYEYLMKPLRDQIQRAGRER